MSQIEKLEKQMNEPNFWDNIDKANSINKELTLLKKETSQYKELSKQIDNDLEMTSLLELEPSEELQQELEIDITKLEKDLEELEINTLLSGEYDNSDCYLEIHPGAGGTESCDWASMLLRMYERFCEIDGLKYEEIDSQEGEEAGLKSVMIKITGSNAFGYLKNESGVHRLVRISPFDSNKRRHTSFASVTVTPVFDKVEDVEIDEKDLKIDVFHSSGAGGQSVNTSNSAVRITHLPTKIVVSVQNERSQLKNKEIALEILQSKLYAIKLAEREDALSAFKKGDSINFGSQIRSYVLEPYKMVKDHRTDFESTDPEGILDGEIKDMLEYNLRNLK
jgi:peptide chain release factor 2